jgi:hypothetical protein
MQSTEARQLTENYLKHSDGLLSECFKLILEDAKRGCYEIKVSRMSDITQKELEKWGYQVSNLIPNKMWSISWEHEKTTK